eukprot:19607_1
MSTHCTPRSKLVAFDWDDTLFPKTALHNGSLSTMDDIARIAESVHQLLVQYIDTFGAENVIIITNGKQEWVQRSLDILNKMTNFKIPFIGSVMKVLSHYKLYIVSAQELYRHQYPKENHLWKMMAFRQLLYDRFVYPFPSSSTHESHPFTFVCVTDSRNEYEGAKAATKWIQNEYNKEVVTHRIKLKSKPKLKDMLDEIKLLLDLAAILYSSDSPIDINYQKEYLRYRNHRKPSSSAL